MIRELENTQLDLWDSFVSSNPLASVYHLTAFKKSVETTYGHTSHYLINKEEEKVTGVLPLFHIKSFFLGNALVSLPFCDYGGVVADDQKVRESLISAAFNLAEKLSCSYIELRQTGKMTFSDSLDKQFFSTCSEEKVRMRLNLAGSGADQFSQFPAKLRSQIRKPRKEGCVAKVGGEELIDDFYSVFTHNMRDLGSPVHSRKMMVSMLKYHKEHCRLFVVYHNNQPVACSLTAGFRDTLVNPWASFMRMYQKIAPNMLLYWEMLLYAINAGYDYFDFGRSSVGEGTFKFKAQWGAQPEQLYWYKLSKTEQEQDSSLDESKKGRFINIWRKVPLPLTKLAGPVLRKHLHM
jgi:serine/alanine adding enzyme